MKRTFVGLLMFLVSVHVVLGGGLSVGTPVLQPGEELTYKVKWEFLRLGTIKVRLERDSVSKDSTSYKIIMLVESNPALMFVRIREYCESVINAADMMSRRFFGTAQNGSSHVEIRYAYEKASRQAYYRRRDLVTGKVERSDTLRNIPPYVEGPALFFYSRWQSRSGKILNVPTMVNDVIENTELNFGLGRESLTIDAFDRPIFVRKYTCLPGAGSKNATSAGVSGRFTGWISDDEAAVPIRVEMRVLLGSVRIELEKWSRPGWEPPTNTPSR